MLSNGSHSPSQLWNHQGEQLALLQPFCTHTTILFSPCLLQGRANSDSMLGTFTLTFASHCCCSLKGHCLYIVAASGNPSPLPEGTHPFPEVGHSRRYLQDNGQYFLNSNPSLSCTRTSHTNTQPRWLFWDFSLPSSGSVCFHNKSIPCLNIFSLLTGLGIVRRLSLDSVTFPTFSAALPLRRVCTLSKNTSASREGRNSSCLPLERCLESWDNGNLPR